MIESWAVNLLPQYINIDNLDGEIWIPGPLDLNKELVYNLYNRGCNMLVSDGNLSDLNPGLCDFLQIDFLDTFQAFVPKGSILISVPPEKQVGEYVRLALEYNELATIAVLARADFKHDTNNADLFTRIQHLRLTSSTGKYFTEEIVLTDKFKGLKLNYSWFVWGNDLTPKTPKIYWEGRPVRDE